MKGAVPDSRSVDQGRCRRRKSAVYMPGCKLLSDVETAATPSLQFCMASERVPPLHNHSIGSIGKAYRLTCPSEVVSRPSWSSQRTELTGNVFIDYRRYSTHSGHPVIIAHLPSVALELPLCIYHPSILGPHEASRTAEWPRYLLSSSRDCSIALYDLEADMAWNLNGGFGPDPKVHPVGYVQRKPDRQGKRTTRQGFNVASSTGPQRGHSRSATCVEFMPGDNGLFVSAGLDKILKIWDTRAWDCVLDIPVESPILCCAFDRVVFQTKAASSSTKALTAGSQSCSEEAPADLLLAAGCEDGGIRIFDMRCGVAQQTLLGHNGGVVTAAWDLCSSYQLFSGSSDRSIRKWDLRQGDSPVLIFDKNKPDLEFIGNRRSQSPVFRQLLHSEGFFGRGYPGEQVALHEAQKGQPFLALKDSIFGGRDFHLDNVAAAAASAAFSMDASFSPVIPLQASSTLHMQKSYEPVAGRLQPQLQSQGKRSTLHRMDDRIDSSRVSGQRRQSKLQKVQDSSSLRKICHPRGSPRHDPESDGSPPFHEQKKFGMYSGHDMADPHTKFPAARCNSGSFGGQDSTSAANNDLGFVRDRTCASHHVPEKHGFETGGDAVNKRNVAFKRRFDDSPSHEKSAFHTPVLADRNATQGDRLAELMSTYGKLLRAHNRACKVPSAAGIDGIASNDPQVLRTNEIRASRRGTSTAESTQGASEEAWHELGQERCGTASSQSLHNMPSERIYVHNSRDSEWCGLGVISEDGLQSTMSPHPRNKNASNKLTMDANHFFQVCAHDGAVTCLVPSPAGSYLISSGDDGQIRLWNAATGCHCFVYMSLNIIRNRSSPATSNSDSRPRRAVQHSSVRRLAELGSAKACGRLWGKQAAISSTGQYVIHGRGRVLCTYDVFSGAEQQIITPGHTHDIICVAWNGQKGEAYSGASDGAVLIYDSLCDADGQDDEEASEEDDANIVDVVPNNFV
ncbi:wd g-beta repeat-containing protein [Cyclospora cayetanensis]|uniref:Wd g-beta repeat-containing protein n=1 Tax=Cyclospora cayetanensis TaxID=88456 RepID=A0A1D3D461_9EIME|nr:wd g-beta repeat-containing protein [Cyclospora cayetanensis]